MKREVVTEGHWLYLQPCHEGIQLPGEGQETAQQGHMSRPSQDHLPESPLLSTLRSVSPPQWPSVPLWPVRTPPCWGTGDPASCIPQTYRNLSPFLGQVALDVPQGS